MLQIANLHEVLERESSTFQFEFQLCVMRIFSDYFTSQAHEHCALLTTSGVIIFNNNGLRRKLTRGK